MDSGNFWFDEQGADLPYVVCLPGWGYDWRIMSWCRAEVNRIYIRNTFKPGLLSQLADWLKRSKFGPVVMLGWSLGGFAAVDFARAYPELVASLVLVGIRRRYSPEEVQLTKDGIACDRAFYLEGFYRQSFLPAQRQDWAAFRADLLEEYLNVMSIEELMPGLDYLGSSCIDEASLSIRPTLMVHGARDIIALPDEAYELARISDTPFYMLQDAAHAAFLHSDFQEIIRQWLK